MAGRLDHIRSLLSTKEVDIDSYDEEDWDPDWEVDNPISTFDTDELIAELERRGRCALITDELTLDQEIEIIEKHHLEEVANLKRKRKDEDEAEAKIYGPLGKRRTKELEMFVSKKKRDIYQLKRTYDARKSSKEAEGLSFKKEMADVVAKHKAVEAKISAKKAKATKGVVKRKVVTQITEWS